MAAPLFQFPAGVLPRAVGLPFPFQTLPTIEEKNLPFMSLADAKQVLKDHEACHEVSSDKVEQAKNVVLKSHVFASEEEAELHFQNLDVYTREKEKSEEALKTLNPDNCRLDAEKELMKIQIEAIKKTIGVCQGQIYMLQHKTYIERCDQLPIRSIYFLSKHVASTNLKLQEIAKVAERRLAEFNQLVMEVLKENGADMNRSDLLKVIKDTHIFAYYEFIPVTKSCVYDGPAHFTNDKVSLKIAYMSPGIPTQFVFKLDNKTGADLEEQMCKDLTVAGRTTLPPKLIKV